MNAVPSGMGGYSDQKILQLRVVSSGRGRTGRSGGGKWLVVVRIVLVSLVLTMVVVAAVVVDVGFFPTGKRRRERVVVEY